MPPPPLPTALSARTKRLNVSEGITHPSLLFLFRLFRSISAGLSFFAFPAAGKHENIPLSVYTHTR